MSTRTILKSGLLSDSNIAAEIALEREAIDEGRARYRKLAEQSVDRGDGPSLKPAERWLLRWVGPVAAEIAKDRRKAKAGKPDVGINVWGPVLMELDPEVVALVAVREALAACMTRPDGEKVIILANSIGRAVLAEAARLYLKGEKTTEVRTRSDGTAILTEASEWNLLCKKYRTLDPRRVNWWMNKHVANTKTFSKRNDEGKVLSSKKQTRDPIVYSHIARIHIGVRLLWHVTLNCNCSMGPTTIDANGEATTPWKSAFHRGRDRKGANLVRADDMVFKIIADGHAVRELLRPKYQPMIVEPYPWVQKHDDITKEEQIEGGYAIIRTPFVAKPTRSQKAALAAADKSAIFEHLSDLSSTPLRVNRQILETARALAGSENVPGIPSWNDRPLPAEHENWDGLTDAEKKEWKKQYVIARKANRQLASERVEYLARTLVAEKFLEDPQIWFPHQLDFRSRAYPIPAHLNFHGEDLCRGLLEFADARQPGPVGIRNLKLHAASCWGLDKASITSRLAWTEANMESILRVAREPLDFHWWMQADGGDQAWQFLAACLAIADPDGAGAHLPVKRDGTCNGLQHYAAMGLDPIGAAAVNLMPATEDDTPADVYAAIAASSGDRIARSNSAIASLLDGRIDRWVVKPNVMTKTYGVTAIGARKQLSPRLAKRGVPQEHVYECASHLSKIVLASIGDVCPAAAAIMDWLKVCAKLITTGRKGRTIEWVTPLGFPVVQPYKRWKNVEIATISQKIRVGLDEEGLPPKASRQINGLAPNFVHSIDATHMLRTARASRQAGLAFVAVHDAFWTHAEDADQLCDITCRTFVDLHTADLAADLFVQFKERYRIDLPPPPARGAFNLEQTRDALYLFN